MCTQCSLKRHSQQPRHRPKRRSNGRWKPKESVVRVQWAATQLWRGTAGITKLSAVTRRMDPGGSHTKTSARGRQKNMIPLQRKFLKIYEWTHWKLKNIPENTNTNNQSSKINNKGIRINSAVMTKYIHESLSVIGNQQGLYFSFLSSFQMYSEIYL